MNMALGVTGVVLVSAGVSYRPLAKSTFARGGFGEKVKGEGENTKPFPRPLSPEGTPPSPFPYFCKKSNIHVMARLEAQMRQFYLSIRAIASWALWDMM
ncbi:hypothetical protein [Nostoc sp. C117]|uniref:hypothetical protein n=1 Tax=Nostoc sp. C117 TaxID=3349875 RepID=UPI00370D47BB